MRSLRALAPIALALSLLACDDDAGGCGGGTCPFSSVAFATIEGTVLRANGQPYVVAPSAGLTVSCAGFSTTGVGTNAQGRFTVKIDLPFPPPGAQVQCAFGAAGQTFGGARASVAFGTQAADRPVTAVLLQEGA
ncbi:hypothetical protein [Gemmatimonas groenlandica]|uniref:Carboxypeptidase regulatory-like domain-containing protein n=1 Tax=Gemmatimonas groenlandica TaxID=2732249 RepID=A0A6M4IIU7_9BACT|nr:hypothetical protein [Gemmatimonas groenlandica]QJR34703.1 hypothetical protein HKW67_03835 [Gemmatimonas groenlandica]